MLRSVLFIAALVAASTTANAGGGHIRADVIRVEPQLSLSFGSRHDGFRVEYESGGRIYNTVRDRHPGRYIMVPPPVAYVPVPVPRPYFRGDGWRDDRHWRDDRGWGRDHRHGRGKHRGHGKGHRHD